MFSNLNSDIIIYGHNHNRSIIEYKGKFYINPGSLGCPSKDKDVARAVILVVEDNVEYENKSIRLPVALIEEVQRLADKNNLSFNKVIIQCVTYALENMDEE